MPAIARRDAAAVETPEATGAVVPLHRPKFVEVEGRGTRGKTTLIRLLMERAVDAGRDVTLIDLDPRKQLGAVFEGVVAPSHHEEVMVWEFLETLVNAQAEAVSPGSKTPGLSLLLDMNGNDPTFARFAASVRLPELLEGMGVQPVRLRVMGPDVEDAEDLGREDAAGGWSPAATALVLNHGTIKDRRPADVAFAAVRAHPAFRAAVDRGARVVELPALSVMAEVTAAGLRFSRAAERGVMRATSGQYVALWRRAMEEALVPVRDWLP